MSGIVRSFHLLVFEATRDSKRTRAARRTTRPDELSEQIFSVGNNHCVEKTEPQPYFDSGLRIVELENAKNKLPGYVTIAQHCHITWITFLEFF